MVFHPCPLGVGRAACRPQRPAERGVGRITIDVFLLIPLNSSGADRGRHAGAFTATGRSSRQAYSTRAFNESVKVRHKLGPAKDFFVATNVSQEDQVQLDQRNDLQV
jgi:hypothetical protein